MKETLAAVEAEAQALYEKHGPLPPEVEEVRYHVQRAMHTLEAAVYTYPYDVARVRDRLQHLGAVCLRADVALRAARSVRVRAGADRSGGVAMSILAELNRLAALYPPPPAYPEVLTVISCPAHNGGPRTMPVSQIVDTARQMWRKAEVRSLACGCVLVLPEEGE